MVGKPYGPRGFPFQLIDSWTCSGHEHETSAGGEHPLLSAHLSRGAFTVCSCKEIDVHFFSTFHSQFQLPSLTPCFLSMGLVRSLYCSLQCVWASAASPAVTSTLGGPLFHSVKTPPLHAEMQRVIFHASQLCLSCLAGGSVTGKSVRSHHSCHSRQVFLHNCNWHKKAGVCHKVQLPILTCSLPFNITLISLLYNSNNLTLHSAHSHLEVGVHSLNTPHHCKIRTHPHPYAVLMLCIDTVNNHHFPIRRKKLQHRKAKDLF